LIPDAICLHLILKVFAKPIDEQEDEVFFYSMMFLVLAVGAGITMFLTVCMSVLVDVICKSSMAVLILNFLVIISLEWKHVAQILNLCHTGYSAWHNLLVCKFYIFYLLSNCTESTKN